MRRRLAGTCWLLLGVWLLSGCALQQPAADHQPAFTWQSVRLAPGAQTLELRSGQVVVTDSGGPAALFFALFAADYSPFVHAGILVMEEDEPFVYETYGRIRPRFGRRPTDLIRGRVQRSPLAEFVRRGKYVEIYELPPGVDAGRVTAYARAQHDGGTPFDPYFRSDEHDALYCTELVALALDAGGWQAPAQTPFPENPSLTRVRHWLGITGHGTVQARQLIAPERLVASLSVLREPERFQVYIELKRELHRRFTADQKLGNLFEWDGRRLLFRRPVQEYLMQGVEMYRGREVPPQAEVRREVRALAVRMFGPAPG
ncbi:MAG: YiiX/YebB-like N1pC/P60 family cysteine hydrolase [Gammaproteobacteria bacterium]|jgi:hypothetical protein